MIPPKPSRQVKSVQNAIEILNVVQKLGSASPTQLYEHIDLSKSSLHNYLTTLEYNGYVVKESGGYRLGLRSFTHGTAAKNSLDIGINMSSRIQSITAELSHPTWWVMDEIGRGFFLEGAKPNDQFYIYGDVGKRSYLHTHALGKAILASATDEYIDSVIEYHGLPQQTDRTLDEKEQLISEVEKTRERGYATSNGESVLGILSVGAGFRDLEGRRHAIGVFADSREFSDDRTRSIGEQLMEYVNSIEAEIGER